MLSIDPSFKEKISIIMPVHNNENYIKAAIDSVLNQTYTNFELLVIDDFSSDRSVAYAEDYSDSRIKIFKLEANLGAAAARNIGLRNATGDYIAFLDSDDCWLPDKLEIQLERNRKNAVGTAGKSARETVQIYFKANKIQSKFTVCALCPNRNNGQN